MPASFEIWHENSSLIRGHKRCVIDRNVITVEFVRYLDWSCKHIYNPIIINYILQLILVTFYQSIVLQDFLVVLASKPGDLTSALTHNDRVSVVLVCICSFLFDTFV